MGRGAGAWKLPAQLDEIPLVNNIAVLLSQVALGEATLPHGRRVARRTMREGTITQGSAGETGHMRRQERGPAFLPASRLSANRLLRPRCCPLPRP